jgi:hypothetical protein
LNYIVQEISGKSSEKSKLTAGRVQAVHSVCG